jgi:outer membrane protein assembly factor BamE (lipoprotein component of BamABCDE complex)
MGWLARALAVVAAVFAAVACDPSGKVYEDVRLARLKEGESTEQDVRKLFGSPQSVREIAGGKGLVYPLGPEGPYTLLIRIGADGKYIGRENLLTRANFGRVNTGMKQTDVLAVLGPPGRSQEYKLKNETAWEWRFNDGAETRMFVVMFNADGVVVSTAIEEDPRRMGGS